MKRCRLEQVVLAAWRLASALVALLCALNAAGSPAAPAARVLNMLREPLRVSQSLLDTPQRLSHLSCTPPLLRTQKSTVLELPGPCNNQLEKGANLLAPARLEAAGARVLFASGDNQQSCWGAGAVAASWGGPDADWSGVPVLDLPLANPQAVLAENRQRLGLNARNIYAVASPVCSLQLCFWRCYLAAAL